MARKSAGDRELEIRSQGRPSCFGACNIFIDDCKSEKNGDCPSLEDCLVASKILNNGYDPNSAEEPGKNEATFDFTKHGTDAKIKIEKRIDAEKAKEAPPPAARGRSRGASQKSTAAPEADAPVVDDNGDDDINKVLGDLGSEGERAQGIRGEELGEDDLSGLDGLEQQEQIEGKAQEAASEAIDEGLKQAEPAPSPEPDTINGVSINDYKYLIDYAADRFAEKVLSMFECGKVLKKAAAAAPKNAKKDAK